MKKNFKLKNLECANCAAKMETAINKIGGVTKATVSFMTQKLALEADDARYDDILKQVSDAIRKVEPDCEIML